MLWKNTGVFKYKGWSLVKISRNLGIKDGILKNYKFKGLILVY